MNVAMAQIDELRANRWRAGRRANAQVFQHVQQATLEPGIGIISDDQNSQTAIAFFVKRYFNGLIIVFRYKSTFSQFSI